MESPSNREIAAPPAAATADRLAFAVGAGEGGERLDRFLSQAAAARGLALSRTRLKALIEAGQVTIDGAEARDPAARVAEGERIALAVPPAEDAAIAGEDLPLRIVFEDEHLLVVDKPAGLVVHPARRPRRRNAGQRADRAIAATACRASAGSSARGSSIVSTRTRPACWSSPRTTPPTRGSRRCSPTTAAAGRSGANIARSSGARPSARREPSTAAIGRHPFSREKMAVVARQARPGGGHPLARRGTARRPVEPRRLPARDGTHPPDPRPSRPYRPSAARRFGLRSGFQDQGEPAVRGGAGGARRPRPPGPARRDPRLRPSRYRRAAGLRKSPPRRFK